MVQVDGAGSDSLVDPGVACWVGISGAPEAREERGLSAWQFAVLARSKAELQLAPRSTCLELRIVVGRCILFIPRTSTSPNTTHEYNTCIRVRDHMVRVGGSQQTSWSAKFR